MIIRASNMVEEKKRAKALSRHSQKFIYFRSVESYYRLISDLYNRYSVLMRFPNHQFSFSLIFRNVYIFKWNSKRFEVIFRRSAMWTTWRRVHFYFWFQLNHLQHYNSSMPPWGICTYCTKIIYFYQDDL